MPRFEFQLEAVLRHRLHVERQRQRDLAGIQSELTSLQQQLRALDQTLQQSNQELRSERLTGTLDLQYLAAHRRFTLALQQRAVGLMRELAEVQRRLTAAQAALAEAARQRRVMEKLREQQEARWVAEIAHRESAELEEVGMRMNYQWDRLDVRDDMAMN